MKKQATLVQRTAKLVSDQRFFKAIVALLVLQAAWIAATARYPAAFDEDFHLGIIRLYAHHLSPFWSQHPVDGDMYGAVTRDPSYLYHYLMSFPYRLIAAATANQTIQVMILRAINIALFASCLPLYRRLMLKLGASRAVAHVSLLLFIMIPIVPFLAAQINYDNMIIPLTALTLLLALRLNDSLKANSLDTKALLQLLIVGLLSSIVKYAYLPVFVAAGFFLLYRGYKVYGHPVQLQKAIARSWRKQTGRSRWWLLAGLVLAAGLFGERFGVNIVRYHTPVPDCAQVLTYDHCQYYPVWIRDYNFEHAKADDTDKNPARYGRQWIYGLWFRTYFAVDGPASNFATRGPLTVPALGGAATAAIGLVAFMLAARRMWRGSHAAAFTLLSLVIFLSLAALWQTDYAMFVQTGVPVAINGRYLLPILPLAVVMTSIALKRLLGNRQQLQLIIVSGVVICSFWGGGALTYILRSNDGWYWFGTPLKSANHAAQRVLGPITPGYNKPTQYLH